MRENTLQTLAIRDVVAGWHQKGRGSLPVAEAGNSQPFPPTWELLLLSEDFSSPPVFSVSTHRQRHQCCLCNWRACRDLHVLRRWWRSGSLRGPWDAEVWARFSLFSTIVTFSITSHLCSMSSLPTQAHTPVIRMKMRKHAVHSAKHFTRMAKDHYPFSLICSWTDFLSSGNGPEVVIHLLLCQTWLYQPLLVKTAGTKLGIKQVRNCKIQKSSQKNHSRAERLQRQQRMAHTEHTMYRTQWSEHELSHSLRLDDGCFCFTDACLWYANHFLNK